MGMKHGGVLLLILLLLLASVAAAAAVRVVVAVVLLALAVTSVVLVVVLWGCHTVGLPASVLVMNSKGTHSVPNLSLQLAARLQYYHEVVLGVVPLG